MDGVKASTDYLNVLLENGLHEIFLPILFKIIGPFLIAIVIFSIIRAAARLFFRDNKTAKILIDGGIVLLFLLFCGVVLIPNLNRTIENLPIHTLEDIQPPENEQYQFSDPFAPPSDEYYEQMFGGYEFSDPFAPPVLEDKEEPEADSP